MTNKIIANNRKNLQEIIQLEIKINGSNCDLNHIDVSGITNMHGMFYESQFNGDISRWNVHKVKNMAYMFGHSNLSGDLNKWVPLSLEKINDTFPSGINTPYWNIKDKKDRDQAINSYLFEQHLNNTITKKDTHTKKHKS